MSSDHCENTLNSLCLLVVDCPHATPKWTESGYVVLRNQNIKGGRLDLTQPSFTDDDHFKGRIKRAAPQCGDIVITREAPMGDVCQIPAGLVCCLGQRQVLLRPNPSKIDGRYMLYALQSPYIQNQIGWNEGTGSTVSNLRIPVLEALKIPTPPIDVQREIAGSLGAIDDRIALLRETNATLEAIAQALFKSWFVDFDPVRAKQQGQMPEGMDEATSALFPDSFEESELGLVPYGWTPTSFGQTITVIGGGTPKTSNADYWNGDIPWFSVVDSPANHDVFVVRTEKYITDAGVKNSSTKILPVGTTIISARGTVGKLALTGVPMAMNQSCYGLRGKVEDSYFTYYSTSRIVEVLKQMSHGSVFDTITRDTLDGISVVYPTASAIKAFDDLIAPVMERIKANLEAIGSLSFIRDTLLPRLISGQLRIPEAKQAVEEATA
ncbi:restriction endonuclease subunit S [Undibacterium sp. WLHG33]|uniref:restriction endonuclease subunit S n=1 Tax=Undibacterium sp. WLHG33 TaxID=3412482 RepID=UPI003C30D781